MRRMSCAHGRTSRRPVAGRQRKATPPGRNAVYESTLTAPGKMQAGRQ